MRKADVLLGLALMTGAIGCAPDGGRFHLLRPNGVNHVPTDVHGPVPAKEDLVAYLNNNSERISGIQSDDISLTCYAGGSIGIPLNGRIRAQGPRNFRMIANFSSSREVDLGSNSQEFWYYITRADPPAQVFCSYQAMEEGKVKQMPFPFQPDWVLEAMGMGKYGPAEKYEMVVEEGKYKLIERTKSPQGVPVKKIIVFNRSIAKKDEPQITDFLLVDAATGKLICSAKITRRQFLPSGAELPRDLELEWKEQKLKLVLHLTGVQLNPTIPAHFFVRTQLKGIPSYDLATGRQEALQQAGGTKGPGIQH